MTQPLVTGIADIYLNVQDMDRAVAFYREVLGLRIAESDAWWTSCYAGTFRIGLHGTGGQPLPPIPHDAHGPHCGAILTFAVADIDAAVARLRSHGVTVLGEISRNPWGDIAVFQDSEGNILKLMQRPLAHSEAAE